MSEVSSEVVVVKPTSPSVEGEVVHDSEEYESAEEIEGEEYEEEVEEIEEEVDEEDGEEDKDETKEKPLDDDEDRKNPQFIPKKGYFYEHDDRMSGEPAGEEEKEPQQKEERPKKEGKVITDRWSHDLFDENQQAPKSNSELEEHYGYDIRTDDMAPRARRKRIYGRGPTKYTRNWEEEEAYQRPRGGFRGRRTGSRGRDFRQPSGRGSKGYDNDFPQLPEDNKKDSGEKTGETPGDAPRNESGDRPQRGGRGGTGRPYQRRDEDDGNEDRDRNVGRSGQNRGGRGRGGRRNEFSNRNRYPDRRDSGTSFPESNNTTNNRSKTQEDRDWAHKVDRIREQDKVVQKQANGTRGTFSPNDRDTSASKNSGSGRQHQQQAPTKKPTLPFTNTEYTGSASLTAHRTQEPRSNSNYDADPVGNDRENISVKLINSGPDQGNREVRISDKDRWLAGNQGSSGADRRSQPPSRPQQQQPQSGESVKPKRFSSQRQKQDAPLNAAAVSASPPLLTGGARSSPQPQGVPPIAGSVPVSVISGYPTQHPQAYYEQVSVPMPTNYEAQGYEASGSPIPITAHGPSVSPSLWASQHAAYSTSSYPTPPTGPPSVQPGYDPSGYISAPQPQIFAPPPHPHPQFISDPTIINYVPPGPPPSYGAPFHAQGFQGYPQVNPGPELYHGGVTYYSPQTQISRPHMVVPTKRPKSVLQFVEPSKRDLRHGGPRSHIPSQEELLMSDMYLHQYREESLPHVVDYMNSGSGSSSEFSGTTGSKLTTEQQLSQKFEESVTLQPKTESIKKTPSPAPLDLSESQSWGDQMAELTPLNSPSEPNAPKNFCGSSQGDKPEAPGIDAPKPSSE